MGDKRPKYYIETSAMMELIEQPKTAPICIALQAVLQDADDGKCDLVTSSVTLVEMLFSEHEKKNGKPDPKVSQALIDLWLPEACPIQIVSCHELIAREALHYFRDHWSKDGWSKSKGKDLVHLVTAKREKVEKFITCEGSMAKWAPVMGFAVCRPEDAVQPKKAKERGLFAGDGE